jgi:glycosyltransferase involved in cell wall biosynthesis
MKVLYVNHTPEISGAERSLLGLLAALPDGVSAAAAIPRGALAEAIGDLGVPTSTITATAGSLRLHPLHTPRALAEMAAAARQLRRIARAGGAELVHANTIRAGIILALARPSAVARVVHVRDCLPQAVLTSAAMRVIAASADVVVANSRYTADWMTASAPKASPRVVHNAVDLTRFDPASIDLARARAALGVPAERGLLLGVVGQLTPWKGQDTAVQALGLLRTQGVDAHLLLIGSAKFRDRATRLDNEAFVTRLHALVAAAGLQERVTWLGEREDVPELVRALDVLLAPSTQEPFGRSLIEAMALGVPVVATDEGGTREIVSDGCEGLLVPPARPGAWADAIRTLGEDAALRAQMGQAGRRRVERAFTPQRHAAAMLEVYEQALAAARERDRPARASARRGRARTPPRGPVQS